MYNLATMKRDVQMNTRVAEEEAEAYREAADEAGVSLSDWIRLMLNAASGKRGLEKQLRRASSAGERAKR